MTHYAAAYDSRKYEHFASFDAALQTHRNYCKARLSCVSRRLRLWMEVAGTRHSWKGACKEKLCLRNLWFSFGYTVTLTAEDVTS